MSDPKDAQPEAPFGDPVVEPDAAVGEPVAEPEAAGGSVDDVVGRAQEALADADAARDAIAPESPVTDAAHAADDTSDAVEPEATAVEQTVVEEVVVEEAVAPASADATPDGAAADDVPWYDRPDADEIAAGASSMPGAAAAEAETVVVEEAVVEETVVVDEAPTVVAAPVVTPSEPTAPAMTPPAQQPIFVQAPEPPRPRGNRGAAGAIGILAALAFGVLYLGTWLGLDALNGAITGDNFVEALVAVLGTWSLWVPIVVFFLAFWLLGGILNRARWGYWVIFGLLVGAAAYGGHILGALFQAPFWFLTAREGAALAESQLLAPLAIAAFIFARERTIWFGAWVASRGKRVTELNNEAQREYERTLEAGPQLYQG